LKSVCGVVFCVSTAAWLSLVMNDDADLRLAAPLICLFAVLLAAFVWGRAAGILGAVGASVVFAIYLFPPIGNFRVNSPDERVIIFTFVVIAVAATFLAPPTLISDGRDRNNRWGTETNPDAWRGLKNVAALLSLSVWLLLLWKITTRGR
jgi:K+-sensing histidine kinase KdpD